VYECKHTSGACFRTPSFSSIADVHSENFFYYDCSLLFLTYFFCLVRVNSEEARALKTVFVYQNFPIIKPLIAIKKH
jgi:hypothetical protein